jgi:hypothetical protein
VSVDGNTAILGGPFDNPVAGAAWVYTRSGGVWAQQGSKLVGAGAVGGPELGHSVALSADGNTAIVGEPNDNSTGTIKFGPNGIGASWIYTRSGGVWTQLGAKLVGTGGVGTPDQGFPSRWPPTAIPLSSAVLPTTLAPGRRGSLSRGRCKSRLRPASRPRASKGRSSRPRRFLIS